MPTAKKKRTRNSARCGNQLIDALPAEERHEVLSRCTHVDLPAGRVLCKLGKPHKYAYFPKSGSIALMQGSVGHVPLETHSIGEEGMLGVTVILEINRAFQGATVRIPSLALRMEIASLQKLLLLCPMLKRGLQRYLFLLLSDLPQTVACMRFHSVPNRLARALLVVHDRVRQDDLPLLTQTVLAEMLGVQRGSVTLAAAGFQREGIIRYQRGRICILDRERLEARSCACYSAMHQRFPG
jgi:CRP-like cAMP-binding protein